MYLLMRLELWQNIFCCSGIPKIIANLIRELEESPKDYIDELLKLGHTAAVYDPISEIDGNLNLEIINEHFFLNK